MRGTWFGSPVGPPEPGASPRSLSASGYLRRCDTLFVLGSGGSIRGYVNGNRSGTAIPWDSTFGFCKISFPISILLRHRETTPTGLIRNLRQVRSRYKDVAFFNKMRGLVV